MENTYRPLRAMIQMGPLRHQMAVRDGFVRILGGLGGDDADRIDAVTASADSRVGNPVTFCEQDETGLWTKRNRMTKVADAQRRGLAGMVVGRSRRQTPTTARSSRLPKRRSKLTWLTWRHSTSRLPNI